MFQFKLPSAYLADFSNVLVDYLKKTIGLLFLLSSPLFLLSQQNTPLTSIDWSKACGTMQLYTQKQLQQAQSYPIPNRENLRNGLSSWNVNNGYGTNCTHDCNTNPYDNAPLVACDGGKYQIPFSFTIIRECGTGNLPDGFTDADALIAKLDDQITEANTYFDCAGIPLVLVKCTTHGQHTEADNSTRILTDATLCSFDGNIGPGTDNEYAGNNTDIAHLLNIYIAQEVRGSTTCNGFAFLPTGLGAPDRMVMQASCFNSFASAPSDPCNDPGRASVFIHEVGHYLGLYHTHNPHEENDPNSGSTAYALPSDPPCTSGDFIADTAADPNFPEFGIDNDMDDCKDEINGTTNDNAFNSQNPSIDYDNIMSYNNYLGCRLAFSDCQKAKMIDALLCGRANIICEDPALADNDNSSNYMSETSIEICIGDPIPTFNVDMPNGAIPNIDTDCIAWYDKSISGDLLGTGTTFTPPTTGAGAIDNRIPGTYTYWWDDDVNQYTITDNDDFVRKSVNVVVLNDPGAASPTTLDASGGGTFNISSSDELIGDNDILGWFLSDSDPRTTWNTRTEVMRVIDGATTVSGTFTALNQMMHSNSGSPASDLSNIAIDCGMIGGDDTYYITPFVAYGDADVECSSAYNSYPLIWLTSTNQGGAASGPNGPSSCNSGGLTNFTYQLNITITEFSGTNSGSVFVNLRSSNACGDLSFNPSTAIDIPCTNPPCTGAFSQTEIEDILGTGFDPTTDQFCLSAIDGGPSGDVNTVITFIAEMLITYTGDNGSTKWTNNGTPTYQVETYDLVSCFWGIPQIVDCAVSLSSEWLNFTGKALNHAIQLNWTTATELDNDYFTLEKSIDGEHFDFLGKIKGAGNSQKQNNYQFIDLTPHPGVNYYRLLQTDFSGKTQSFHKIVAVDFIKNNVLAIYPNPINNETLIIHSEMENEQVAYLEIFDMKGQIIQSEQLFLQKGKTTYPLYLSNLSEGLYLFRAKMNEKVENIRFIKQ